MADVCSLHDPDLQEVAARRRVHATALQRVERGGSIAATVDSCAGTGAGRRGGALT